jgi:hypothetical protein
MTEHTDVDLPASLGLLPDATVEEFLSHAIRSGQDAPPPVALRKASIMLPATEARWRTGPVRELLAEAMRRFDDDRVKADGWLAPRLHATIRMTRGEAADSRRWNFLAMIVAPDYVLWRHGSGDLVAAGRFCGPHYTQAFARLWWAAELFRNGADYRPVELACSVQDVLNTTMRLDVIDHRPTALAILEVLAGLVRQSRPRLGDHVNALSSSVNAAGSTLVYDTLAQEEVIDTGALQDWITDSQGMPPVPWERLPYGPEDLNVKAAVVDGLIPLFERLLADAPMRQRPRHSASSDES